MECPPGQGYLGAPLKKLDFGETEIDHETFYAYVEELRSVWTPAKYHLLRRNCNNFSDELVEFLTGRHVPQDIIESVPFLHPARTFPPRATD